MALQVNLENLRKVGTPLLGIGSKPVKVEESVDLPITLGEKKQRKIVRQSFMVAKIDTLYNTIFGRPVLSKLNVVLSSWYLLMKFKTNEGIKSVMDDQIKARKGCILVAIAVMKQPKVMILKTLEE